MRRLVAAVTLGLVIDSGAPLTAAQPVTPAIRAELAPTGTLRVGINYGNVILADKEAATGELKGVHVDLARELGRRVGVPVELVGFASAAPMVDAIVAGRMDVALISADPTRASDLAFTPAYLTIEATYLVPAASSIRDVADVDREGMRLSVAAGSAYELHLKRTLRRATLIGAPSTHEALGRFTRERLDALVGLRPRLEVDAAAVPGARILTGGFMTIEQAMASSKAHPGSARFLAGFVADLVESGFLTETLARHGVRGVSIPATVR